MKRKIFFTVTLCIPFIVLEVLFRLLPVSYPPYILEVNEKNPVARYQTSTDYLWSKGFDFNIVTRKHTNNLGFVNDYDYARSNLDPLMVVIGDNFVEAQQIANAESMSGILAEKVKPSGRVYSLGISGAALSQYLAFAEYGKNVLSPDSMVFIITGNDFGRRNLLKYLSKQIAFHYFEEKDGRYVLTRIDYKIRTINKILRKFAFFRYIKFNLETYHVPTTQLLTPDSVQADDNSSKFIGNLPRNVSNQYLIESEKVVDEFFHQLPFRSGLDKNNILFLLDGIRPSLYSDQGLIDAKNSYFDRMRSYFKMTAERLGYEVKDMQPVFIKKNRYDGSTFEFPTDSRWNKSGHKLAASEIERSQVYKRTFQNPEKIQKTRQVSLG